MFRGRPLILVIHRRLHLWPTLYFDKLPRAQCSIPSRDYWDDATLADCGIAAEETAGAWVNWFGGNI